MFLIFWRNFISYDVLIFILAVINFYIYQRTNLHSKRIQRSLYPRGFVPGGNAHKKHLKAHYEHFLSLEGEEELFRERRKMNLWYSFFNNITSIFPLMGILGTVISLIGMVGKGAEETNSAFFLALTSTLWGIVFAIVYKAVNGYLAADIDSTDEVFELYIERNSRRLFASADQDRDVDDASAGRDDMDREESSSFGARRSRGGKRRGLSQLFAGQGRVNEDPDVDSGVESGLMAAGESRGTATGGAYRSAAVGGAAGPVSAGRATTEQRRTSGADEAGRVAAGPLSAPPKRAPASQVRVRSFAEDGPVESRATQGTSGGLVVDRRIQAQAPVAEGRAQEGQGGQSGQGGHFEE